MASEHEVKTATKSPTLAGATAAENGHGSGAPLSPVAAAAPASPAANGNGAATAAATPAASSSASAAGAASPNVGSVNGGGDGADGLHKLFVGQVPPSTTETDLSAVFSPFGKINEIAILKDNRTGAHRGCAFVTYMSRRSAEAAIAALDEKHQFPTAKKALAVRFASLRGADGSRSAPAVPEAGDFKLYVGMLSRQTGDEDVRRLFEPYGVIKEIHILRQTDAKQTSKGAAFVRFSRRDEAERAITALHERHRDKEAPGLLQVRFAHTKAEKQMLGIGPGGAGPAGHGAIGVGAGMGAAGVGLGGLHAASHAGAHGVHAHGAHGAHGAAGLGVPALGLGGLHGFSANGNGAAAAAVNPAGLWGLQAPSNPAQPYYHPQINAAGPGPLTWSNPAAVQGHNVYGAAGVGAGAGAASAGALGALGSVPGMNKEARGPPGSNLFIYNLPLTFTDSDLASLFSTFGAVVSSHVQRDRATGASKGFGFVSFDQPATANAAISALDGFVVGTRKLSVRLKKDGDRPY